MLALTAPSLTGDARAEEWFTRYQRLSMPPGAATIGGIAVHLAARIVAVAGTSEVVVSRTLTDLVVGSGITFEDQDVHELKGIPGPWHLSGVTRVP